LEALIPDLKKTWKQRQNGSRIQDLKWMNQRLKYACSIDKTLCRYIWH
jgi:hypothetical protein